MLYHVAVQLVARLVGTPPPGSGWLGPDGSGYYYRVPTDAVIQHEIDRAAVAWSNRANPAENVTVLSWRRLSQAEHDMFGTNRHYRNALEEVAGVIQHNMPSARELHRQLLRHQRAEKLLILDAAYNGASAQGDNARAARIEALRQTLRDLTSDPRIDAANNISELAQIGLASDGEQSLEELRAELRNL
jgi:hypothetical protein